MNVQFTVSNQHIEAKVPAKIVADTKNYLWANFFFVTSEWEDVEKTAVFSNQLGTFSVLLEENHCLVPWECLTAGDLSVSVFGGDRITTDVVKIRVFPSGYRLGETPREPTPDVYAEILDRLRTLQGGTVSKTDIETAVADYLKENPVQTLAEDDVVGIVSEYLGDHKVVVDESVIEPVVQAYFADHASDFKGDAGEQGPQGIQGEQGPKGDPGADGETPKVLIKENDSANTVIPCGDVYKLGVVGADSTYSFSFDAEEGEEAVCQAVFVSKDGETPLFNTVEDTDVIVPRILADIVSNQTYRVEYRKSDRVLRIM